MYFLLHLIIWKNINIGLNHDIEMIFNFKNKHDKIAFQTFCFKLFVTYMDKFIDTYTNLIVRKE